MGSVAQFNRGSINQESTGCCVEAHVSIPSIPEILCEILEVLPTTTDGFDFAFINLGQIGKIQRNAHRNRLRTSLQIDGNLRQQPRIGDLLLVWAIGHEAFARSLIGLHAKQIKNSVSTRRQINFKFLASGHSSHQRHSRTSPG